MRCKNYLIVVIFLFRCLLLAQQTKTASWKEYKYPVDGFAIAAPAEARAYPDPQAPDVRIYRWDLPADGTFAIHTGTRPNCQTMINTFRESNGKSLPEGAYVPGSIKDVSQIGLMGVEYETHPPHARWMVERIYCATMKVYILTVAFPQNQARPKTADRMFVSFRLLNPESK